MREINGMAPVRMAKDVWTAKATPLEEDEQEAIFQWAELQSGTHPSLRMIYAIPNGGYRSPKTAAAMKKTGVKSGVPDMCLAVPMDQHHGLYIELKRRKGGRLSENQIDWLERLEAEGYACVVCKGWEEAVEAIKHYLNIR